MIDRDTKDWIRDASDELAANAGFRFDLERAEFACDWIEGHCRLYEGDLAGEPLELLPFQREWVSRLFGWVHYSAEWGEWIRRFRHAGFWAAKKNGKSPLCAATNLYLLIGDGEPGQKVYQAAANGQQAEIAQAHAVNMVRQSPALSGECKIHGSTLTIHHRPSNSRLMILTGDDSRGARAKEGINGSVSFDEMHVVSREVYERTHRAGISRKEPLVISYSTAGDEPDSVGHERCQYGRQVAAGEREDLHYLHVEYAIPADVSEADIDGDVEKYGRMANPAWGALVKPSEFLHDWQTSKASPREMARCLQYRFNKWVGSTNRWLNLAGWQAGKREYSLADLAGRECVAALDLSRTRDMTALVFAVAWPDDGPDAVRLWPLFWLPEETARERQHLFPFLTWAERGWLSLTPGGIVDYGRVKQDVRHAIRSNSLRVSGLYYDEYHANELTQALHEGEKGEPGVVAERIVFPQQMLAYSVPSKEFERRVTAGSIEHPGNGVLDWQIGHVEVETDRNQNIRPVKPSRYGAKGIDGVVCSVMDLAGILARKGEWPAEWFDAILFEEWPAKIAATVLAINPALGKDDGPSANQVHLVAKLDAAGHVWVDADCRRDGMPGLVTAAIAAAKLHRPAAIVVESNPGLSLLLPEFERRQRELPAPLQAMRAEDLMQRIRRLGESYLSRGQVHVRNTPGGRLLVQQLRDFPKTRTDAPNALELAIRRLEWMV